MLRSASQELLRLLAELNVEGQPRPFSRLGSWLLGKNWSPRVSDLIRQIGALKEPVALLNLVHWIHHEDEAICGAAEEAVEVLWFLLKPVALLDLEVRIRESWAIYSSDYDGKSNFRATRPTSWMLASLDPNGFRRERAVQRLDEAHHLEALPCLLLRLNDWVSQVRAAAEHFVRQHERAFSEDQLISVLPILAALQGRRAAWNSMVLSDFTHRLRARDMRLRLLKALPGLPARARRFVFGILGETGSLDDPVSGRFLLESGDPFLPLLFLVTLRKHGKFPSAEWLEDALRSKWPTLRKAALQSWAETSYPNLKERAHQALLDSAAGVRDVANFWVRKLDPAFDLQAYYSAIIAQIPPSIALATAISGFHESGGQWAPEIYSQWFQHPAVAVKTATLRAYAATHLRESESVLEHYLLGTEGPRLQKVAFTILARRPGALPTSTLRKIIESSDRRGARLRALALINSKDKWQSLEHFLHFSREKDEELSAAALRWLQVWESRFNRSYTQPSSAQLACLRRELALSKEVLPKWRYLSLEDLLQTAIPLPA